MNNDEENIEETEGVEEQEYDSTQVKGEDSLTDSGGLASGLVKGEKPTAGNIAKKIASDSEAGQKVAEAVEKVEQVKDTAIKAKTFGTSALAATKAGIAAIFNPVSLIAIGIAIVVFIVAVGLWSANQVLGRNENIDGCAGVGEGSIGQIAIGTDGNVDLKSARNVIGTWLMTTSFTFNGGKPLTKEQAAAMLGNMQQESGLDPRATQSGWISKDASNSQVRAAGASSGGKAIGLIQWDGDRKKDLLDYADSQNKVWSDVTVQLEFLRKEMESTYEANRLKQYGFNDTSKSVKELVHAFDKAFERSGTPNYPNREKYAEEAMASLNPGGTSGMSCLMGSYDNSSAAALAISIAYPTRPPSKVGAGDPNGVRNAPAAYKAAKNTAQAKGGNDPMPTLYASCDRFVATVVKITMDPGIPWGDTSAQFAYLSKSSKWQRYDDRSKAQPGDIWMTTGKGHIIMYVGMVNGKDSIAHASYHDRVGAIEAASYINSSFKDYGGRQYAGFRFVG